MADYDSPGLSFDNGAFYDAISLPQTARKKMAKVKNDAPGMKGERSRNNDGQLREKRGDTYIGTIEKQYNIDLNVRSDMHLDTFLEKNNINTLNDLIK